MELAYEGLNDLTSCEDEPGQIFVGRKARGLHVLGDLPPGSSLSHKEGPLI